MNKVPINEENALDTFVYVESRAAVNGDMVWYAVVCQHDNVDGVGSHGGFICENARSAIDTAKAANERAAEDHTCWYTAIPISMAMATYVQWLTALNMVPPDDQVT